MSNSEKKSILGITYGTSGPGYKWLSISLPRYRVLFTSVAIGSKQTDVALGLTLNFSNRTVTIKLPYLELYISLFREFGDGRGELV